MRGGALILLLLLAACASAPLEQRAWLEVRSPNFSLYSNLPLPSDVRAAAAAP